MRLMHRMMNADMGRRCVLRHRAVSVLNLWRYVHRDGRGRWRYLHRYGNRSGNRRRHRRQCAWRPLNAVLRRQVAGYRSRRLQSQLTDVQIALAVVQRVHRVCGRVGCVHTHRGQVRLRGRRSLHRAGILQVRRRLPALGRVLLHLLRLRLMQVHRFLLLHDRQRFLLRREWFGFGRGYVRDDDARRLLLLRGSRRRSLDLWPCRLLFRFLERRYPLGNRLFLRAIFILSNSF